MPLARVLKRVGIGVVAAAAGLAGAALLYMRLQGIPLHAARHAPPTGIEARALAVGQRAPDFAAPSTIASNYRLSDRLRDGPVVLIFYRGHW
jgi:hypothetical protein